jgi:3-oxoacyl-ACP reductase-like protein
VHERRSPRELPVFTLPKPLYGKSKSIRYLKITVEREPTDFSKNRVLVRMVWALTAMKIDCNRILDRNIQNICSQTRRMFIMQTKSFAGKVALVTGGSKGIGAGIVRRLARDGASVAFTYSSSEEKALQLVGEIESAGGKPLALKADSAFGQRVAGRCG